MKRFTGILFFFFLIPFSTSFVFADSGKGVLPEELEVELKKSGEIVRYYYGDLDLQYLPEGGLTEYILSDLTGLDATIGVEAIFLMKMPEKLAAEENPDLAVYNLINKVSTLTGIEYYSASREKMRTLFRRAYRVKTPDNKEVLPDLTFSSIPSAQDITVFQEDLTFGKNYVSTLYRYNEGRFLMQVNNLTTMWYYILPLVKPGNFRMDLLIVPREDSLIFYGACSVDSASLFGIEKSKKDSFYNRIKAMQNWFSALLEEEFS